MRVWKCITVIIVSSCPSDNKVCTMFLVHHSLELQTVNGWNTTDEDLHNHQVILLLLNWGSSDLWCHLTYHVLLFFRSNLNLKITWWVCTCASGVLCTLMTIFSGSTCTFTHNLVSIYMCFWCTLHIYDDLKW